MSDLLTRLSAALEFDEAGAKTTAKMVVADIEALCWADNFTTYKGIPLVSERIAYHHAKLRPIHKALISLVEAVHMGAFHHSACSSNWYDNESVNPEWDGEGEHRLPEKCTCAHAKIDSAKAALEAALREDEK